jgi:hypothetical protein
MIYTIEIQVSSLKEHNAFLKAVFSNHQHYTFGPVRENHYSLYNLDTGTRIRFGQIIEGSFGKVNLITFKCIDYDDLIITNDLILKNNGKNISEIKEINNNHYSGWYVSPCGWHFGLAHF